MKQLTCDEEVRHTEFTKDNQEKLVSLRATETDLKKQAESFNQKLQLRKKEIHKIEMQAIESDNQKLKEQMDLDAAKTRLRNSSIEVEQI